MKIFTQNKFKKELLNRILIGSILFLVSLSARSQVISNPTVLNSMTLTNLTSTSAKLKWQYHDDEFDSAPAYAIYSRTSSQTLYNEIASKSLNFIIPSTTIKSDSINVTGLQPTTTYTWFLGVLDEAKGMSEPLLMRNYNSGAFLGYSFLTTATYQYITFTTPNASGTGGTPGVVTTVSGSTIPPNQLPVANAGADIALTLPGNTTTLNGLSSTDSDGGIFSYAWSKVAGPTTFTFNQYWTPSPTVSNLVQGTYTFRLVVIDSRGDYSQDFVNVVVNGGTVNQSPVANAGLDKTITLPTNSATLNGSGTDADGTITNYVWIKIAGPSIYGIMSPNAATTVVSNLSQGTYSFQLAVTDNAGAVSKDTVNVTVNPAVVPPTCTNDNFESNNTLGTAAAISAGSPVQAKLCPLTDVDFFSFSNRNAQRNVRVTLYNLPTNYFIELYSPSGALIGTSNAANAQNKVIVFNTTVVGNYKIKVAAGAGAVVNNSNYSLLAETGKNAFAQRFSSIAANGKSVSVANEPNENAFTIYPNPAKNKVEIIVSDNEPLKQIVFYNLSGSVVKEINLTNKLNAVNVSALQQGIYFVRIISTSGKAYTKKIIVVK